MKKNTFGIIFHEQSLNVIYKFYKELFLEINKNFDNFYLIDVSNLILFQKNKKAKLFDNSIFTKKFKYVKIKDSKDLDNFLKDKNLVAINNLGKNPDFYWCLFCLKKNNVKLINILNTGEIGLKTTLDFKQRNFFIWKNFYDKGFYHFFRILTILNILPNIEITFHSNIEAIENLNNSILRKLEAIFPFLKLSYFREIIKINARSFTIKKKRERENYILFIDCPIMSGDRLIRDKEILKINERKFYQNLIVFLKKLSIMFKKKIIISLHPKHKNKYLTDNFSIAKKSTREMVGGASFVVFSTSGAIIDAIFQKKKIINFYSKLQGDYQLDMNHKYVKELNLYSLNLDEKININKKKLIKLTNNSIKSYKKFIKKRILVDGKKDPNKKIIRVIKDRFF